MTLPVFAFQIKCDILPGLVTIGKYDGSHFCLTAATKGSKVLIHSPHRVNREISFLNVSESVTAICAGKLKADEEKDILVIGSPSSVLAYHVDNNSELFFKEVSDGVSAITIGNLEEYADPLLIVGGNCSIQGYDWRGQDQYWTVTGDIVRSLALVDIDEDGHDELIVGSDDFEISVFKQDSMIHQRTETDAVTSLMSFQKNNFVFALGNGSVGMYEKFKRLWKVKSKHLIRCICLYDLDGDGVDELITGWSNGKIDARKTTSAEIIFKDSLAHGIAGIVAGDYKRAGKNQLIVISETGEVKGYDASSLRHDLTVESTVLRDLFLHKQKLIAQLKNYNTAGFTSPGIPASTKLIVEMCPSMGNENFQNNHILLTTTTNTMMYIRAVIIFAEGIFEGETLTSHPPLDKVTSTLKIPLIPPKDIPIGICIKAFIGSDVNYDRFHVYDTDVHLPRFSMYLLVPFHEPEELQSYVNFQIIERSQRLNMWLEHNFFVPQSVPVIINTELDWSIGIKSLRDGSAVNIKYKAGTMTLITENMGLAADLLQSIASDLKIEKLESYVQFPKIFARLESMLLEITNLRQNALKISATIADNAALVRSLTVQAEDARIISHMKDMRDCYIHLFKVNEEMMRNHKLCCNNHEELLTILRNVNLIIQHASKMRVNKNKSEFVSTCRRAVAENNLNVLVKLIKTGEN